mgnify:CR=1 FL=1
MHMQVTRHPRAPGPPLIDPDVHPLGLERPLNKCSRLIHQLPELFALLGGVVRQARAGVAERWNTDTC